MDRAFFLLNCEKLITNDKAKPKIFFFALFIKKTKIIIIIILKLAPVVLACW